jgi:hypothetical protein
MILSPIHPDCFRFPFAGTVPISFAGLPPHTVKKTKIAAILKVLYLRNSSTNIYSSVLLSSKRLAQVQSVGHSIGLFLAY